ncbi:MAG: DUF2127 domain-containing protein [Opitutaceae bacterium]|nr:DUF2127 domain-containing protein [Opitutaceae bacterium]
MPDRTPPPSPRKGLRTIALFEAAKGAVVLVAGFGLLGAIGRHPAEFARRLVEHLHLNPAHHYPEIFITAMSQLDNPRLTLLAALALVYASVRFIEAYGLWRERLWAEWFAVLSGAVYVPAEIYELIRGITGLRVTILAVNLAVVGFLAWAMTNGRRPAAALPSA